MRLLTLLACLLSATASAQSPLTERTGFQLLVSEFNEGGSFGTLAQTEELGGMDSPDHHRFGVDLTALRRWSNGVSLGLRGGVYRYDPVGLGGRVGLTAGLAASAWGSGTLRIETEVAYLNGRFDDDQTAYYSAGVDVDGATVLQQRLPLPGSLDLRLTAGPYASAFVPLEVWDVADRDRQPSEFEDMRFHAGAQFGAALTFALLDARVAIAPSTRVALVGESSPAAFSALPGGGIWVDF